MRVGTRLVSCQFFAQTNQLELGWLIVGQVREGAVWNVFKKIIVVLYSVPLPRSRNMPTTNLAKVSSGHIERWIRCTNSRKYSLKNLFLLHSLARYYHVRSFLQKKLAVLRVWSLLYWPPHRFHRPWRQATQKIWPFRRTFLHETTLVVFWSFRPKATITRLAGGGGGGGELLTLSCMTNAPTLYPGWSWNSVPGGNANNSGIWKSWTNESPAKLDKTSRKAE